LSAGAIGTPQLLMMSGVGAADRLQALGIPVVIDLPGVGENLRDHPLLRIPFRATELGKLPIAGPGSRNQLSLAYTATGSPYRHDMSMTSPNRGADDQLDLYCQMNFAVGSGRITLRSGAPENGPLIELRYLDEDLDRARLRDAARLAVAVLKSHALQEFVAEVRIPSSVDIESDTSLDNWIASVLETAYHGCGTCRMGNVSDEMAVVDGGCRIRGLNSVYIADLSIAPHTPRSSPNATAFMIGERAAELLTEAVG
jgi:choline dehydrogenase-like flavoprotein